jgi:hypothetical protein
MARAMKLRILILATGLLTVPQYIAAQSHETRALLAIPLTETAYTSLKEAGCLAQALPSGAARLSPECVRRWLTPERLADLPFPPGYLLVTPVGTPTGGSPTGPSATSVEQQIRAKCEKDWPGDYRMQLYCVTTQSEAYRKLHGR